MMLPSIVGVISWLCLTTAVAQNISWSKRGCQDKCGNVTIAYPFGIGSECSANSFFTITCNSSTPFLSSINREVVNISVHGVVIVNQPVSPMNCSVQQRTGFLPMSLEGSPFTISARYNSLAVLGCSNSVWLRADETTTVGGCMAICQTNRSADNSCGGLNCCKAAIPQGLQSFQYSYRSIQRSTDSFCGYTFPVDKKWFQGGYKRYGGLQMNQSYPYDREFVSAPLVLEWELVSHVLNTLGRCRYANSYRSYSTYSDEYSDPSASLYYYGYYNGYEYVSSTKYCSCRYGYEGNPYVDKGCVDIDECAIDSTVMYEECSGGACNTTSRNRYCRSGTCINKIGSYTCQDRNGVKKFGIVFISIGSALGALILLFVAWMSVRAIKKRIKAKRRQEFFKRNGGMLLQQQLSSTDSSLEKTKLFSYKELAKATD